MNKNNRNLERQSGGKEPKMHGASKGSGTTKQTMSYRGTSDPRFSGATKGGGSTKQTGTTKGSASTKQYGNYKKGSTRYAGAL